MSLAIILLNRVGRNGREPNFYKRSISKMIYIKEQKNGINSQTNTKLFDNSFLTFLINFLIFKE